MKNFELQLLKSFYIIFKNYLNKISILYKNLLLLAVVHIQKKKEVQKNLIYLL